MITKTNFKSLLEKLEFTQNGEIYIKKFDEFDCELRVDFKNEKLIYPEDKGMEVNDQTTSNFSANENFVVFECVDRLLSQGYQPCHIELERKFQLGHSGKSGKADIFVKDNDGNSLLIIECKTAGSEYKKAINILENDERNQLFSYLQQETSTKFLALYTSDFVDDRVLNHYYLIKTTDNQELLENNPKLQSYKNANTTEQKWHVWQETYDGEYATIGLFEDNKAYDIGKSKFKFSDLKPISSKDIGGKYHEFTSILRKYNISGRENAFDRLVNLFLCKVVDEIQNKDELQFYYKGKAYDNPFDFQDRLQKLYKDGMKEFLGEEITYIDNSKIDRAFSEYDLDVIKSKIKQFLKEQKFFTNNDFAFIDVHNEKLFYQNFRVLLEVVRLIQDINLTGSENNQFLGDMFEGFLDQGVKQSEGQFFTPLPIVRFIINSLPQKENPQVIDYACGAGHFCNEYARAYKDSTIVGIEKEYRLSKVAKVSSFMYGNDVDIIYSDALMKHPKIKDGSFDILIANPPYSVKGFLETLDDTQKQHYELIDGVDTKSYSKTGAIECFFIERAKQLLRKDGFAGIIVPSSILNKDTPKLYTLTREILLKYFTIVAIVEFGSGTFGKTGTNTVTLFLKRSDDIVDEARVYKELAQKIYSGDVDILTAFEHKELLERYIEHIKINKEDYLSLFEPEISQKLLQYDIFVEYKKSFEKLSQTKERRKTKAYKTKLKETKEDIEKKEFLKYVKQKESEKFYYFCLSSKNGDVVIVKSPTNNNEIKDFLGYEWSNRKGDEGIKYITKDTIKIDDGLDEESKRVVQNLAGIESINTPLYNPQNLNDNEKINKIIKDNFEYGKFNIPESLKKYVSSAKLVDMLDLKEVEFSRVINLNVKKEMQIQSKWEFIKLGDISKFVRGVTYSKKDQVSNSSNKILTADNVNLNGELEITKIVYIKDNIKINDEKKLKKNDIFMCLSSGSLKHLGKVAFVKKNLEFYSGGFMGIIRANSNNIIAKYLFEILFIYKKYFEDMAVGANINNLSSSIENLKISLPPLDVQEKIAKECEEVDNINEKLRIENEKLKGEIEKSFNESYKTANKTVRLSDEESFKIFIGKRVLSKDISQDKSDGIAVYSANVFEPFGYTKKEFLQDFSKPSVLWGIDGDWMVNILPKDTPFYPTDHCGVMRVKRDEIEPTYLKFALYQEGLKQRFSRSNRASTARIKSLTIKIPSIDIQQSFSKKVNKYRDKINQNKKIIESGKAKKEEILRKYL